MMKSVTSPALFFCNCEEVFGRIMVFVFGVGFLCLFGWGFYLVGCFAVVIVWWGFFPSWEAGWTRKQIVLESRWENHASRNSTIFSLLTLQGYTYIPNKDEGGSLENAINLKGIPKAMRCCVLGTHYQKIPKWSTRAAMDEDRGVAVLDWSKNLVSSG